VREGAPQDFFFPVRVYYEDTDAGGMVYYANYLKFMERTRTEWLRAAGFEQTALLNDHHVIFVVRSVAIQYLKPALFNDLLRVSVQPLRVGRSQIDVHQAVLRARPLPEAAEVLATAEIKVVCVNGESFKPVRIPGALREGLAASPGGGKASQNK
jgi:acyl-CoA thioester hydrolase